MKQIWINDIPIDVEKKRIKNMYLRILPPDGRVHISAPLKMSEEEIQHFVYSKLNWIIDQKLRMERRPIQPDLQYVTGDTVSIWGIGYTLVLRETYSRNRIEVIGDEILLFVKNESTREQRERILNGWYKKALEAELPFLLARWERNIGVSSSGYKIRDMKTRWGTCNIRTKQICLNLQLAKKPMKCLEYVVVHELVHLLEKSHNQIFKGYMDRFLPQWRSIKRELNGVE
ncbi:MAG: putative metal-dependent hydrolase [Herbinix sp.]|jgi:predicted metal-dependent hydrolase|nr:putative metal-dependent hydrolase [Herbinix sp.]